MSVMMMIFDIYILYRWKEIERDETEDGTAKTADKVQGAVQAAAQPRSIQAIPKATKYSHGPK